MNRDSSAVWLQELIVSSEKHSVNRIMRAVNELRRLGWDCQYSQGFTGGAPSDVEVKLVRTMTVLKKEAD